MKHLLVGATLLSLILSTGAVAAPAAEQVSDIRAYTDTMRDTLAEIGIRVRKIDSPRGELLVVYSLEENAPPPEFALAAVLRLSEPLSDGAETIRLRNVRDGQTLIEVQVRPEQTASVLASTVSDAQRDEIDALLDQVLVASGVPKLRVPRAQVPEQGPAPIRVVQQGAAPIDGFELTAQSQPRQTRPTETFGEQPAEDGGGDYGVGAEGEQELADALFHSLLQADLENLAIARDAGGRWVISFENRTWRSDIDALAKVLEAAARVLPPAPVSAQMKRHDVVVSHVNIELADYVKLEAGILTAEELASNWQVRAGPVETTEPVRVLARGNESYLRTDLLMRPAIDYAIGLENDPFESDYFLVTNVRATLGRGLWADVRFPAQLTSDQQVTMDRALLNWVGRPADGLLAAVSGGRFDAQLHGFYVEARTDTEEHQFGIGGSLTDRGLELNPFDASERAFGYYQYDWGEMGLKSRLGYGEFLECGERGLTLSLHRRFGESTIEARAIRTDDGNEGLTFELSLPLGPRRASSPDTLRTRHNPAVTLDYKSNFNTQGDYLQGSHDLESFRGEISPAYVSAHGERLIDSPQRRDDQTWPAAPSYEGNSGLMRIPTADAAPDGRLFAGISYFDRDHSKVSTEDTDAMPTFIGAGFLPNLELVGRLTFFHDVKAFDWNYNLDRSFNVHYRLNEQRDDWFPALAVGAQDVSFGTSTSYLGQAEYLVGSWQVAEMRAHLGIGSGKFDPVFGGFEYALKQDTRLHLMAEYDSDYVNAGLRWFLDDWGTASVGLLGLGELTGAVTFQTDLQ